MFELISFFSKLFYSLLIGRMAKLFYSHGKFCASHPWEVMVTFLSLAICMFTMGPYMLFDNNRLTTTTTSTTSVPTTSNTIYFQSAQSNHHHQLTPESYKHAVNSVSDDIIASKRYFQSYSNSGGHHSSVYCGDVDCSSQVSILFAQIVSNLGLSVLIDV